MDKYVLQLTPEKEAMARDLCRSFSDGNPYAESCSECASCGSCVYRSHALAFYNQDYRKPIHAVWKVVYRNYKATAYECSNCKHLTLGMSEYCICGAKMKGGE